MSEPIVLIAVLVIVVVALIALNRPVRLWMFKALGVETRIENASHQTRITARRQGTVKRVRNEGGSMDLDARDGGEIEDIENTQK